MTFVALRPPMSQKRPILAILTVSIGPKILNSICKLVQTEAAETQAHDCPGFKSYGHDKSMNAGQACIEKLGWLKNASQNPTFEHTDTV